MVQFNVRGWTIWVKFYIFIYTQTFSLDFGSWISFLLNNLFHQKLQMIYHRKYLGKKSVKGIHVIYINIIYIKTVPNREMRHLPQCCWAFGELIFICLSVINCVRQFLRTVQWAQLPSYNSLSLNWDTFINSGHLIIPKNLTLILL